MLSVRWSQRLRRSRSPTQKRLLVPLDADGSTLAAGIIQQARRLLVRKVEPADPETGDRRVQDARDYLAGVRDALA